MSERVFSNLNSNKVPLTEAELIKGLLLTKISRTVNSQEGKKKFREILELRLSIGHQWDEMAQWSNSSEINSFYFKGEEGMNCLLSLVALSYGYKPNKNDNPKDFPLFNFYHKLGKCVKVWERLNDLYAILNDWFSDDITYNQLGFLFFSKGSDIEVKSLLDHIESSKQQFHEFLTAEVRTMIPEKPESLFYGNNQDDEIHRTLLALNVFRINDARFNFHRFLIEKWTLEHIFPQTPEGRGQKLKEKDKMIIIDMLGERVNQEIRDILNKEERNVQEKEIYQNALKGIGRLNSIGNMCLLSEKDNISNGCGFFDEKRSNILSRIRTGSFVPAHTFDVFSKMVFEMDPGDFERWSKNDIDKHIIKITKSINDLK